MTRYRFKPKRLPTSLFTWMIPLYQMTDEEIMACAGLDALTFIRYLTLGATNTHLCSFDSEHSSAADCKRMVLNGPEGSPSVQG